VGGRLGVDVLMWRRAARWDQRGPLDQLEGREDDGLGAVPLVPIGSAEGSAVAAGAAARHPAPTHVALLPFWAGYGLSDSLASVRDKLSKGLITAADLTEQYDWLVRISQDVHGPRRDSVAKSSGYTTTGAGTPTARAGRWRTYSRSTSPCL
jgi:hypothetical protein